MIISAFTDCHTAVQHKLPPPLFHYIDGGVYAEYTLRRNVEDLLAIVLRQRVLKNISELSLETRLFDETLAMPVALAPVGLTGMHAHRGEVQAARAAAARGVPSTLSTVPVCPIEEVVPVIDRLMWFQLYVLGDRGFTRSALERARAVGVITLVFTVDIPAPSACYRDVHSGMSGPYVAPCRILQAMTYLAWVWNVDLLGESHDPGNTSAYRGNPTGPENYIGWLGANLDPSTSWEDLEWIREFWDGPVVIKGILDPEDARDAVKFGADSIVVPNHGGHQLDDVLSSVRTPPVIVDAAKGELAILADSGIRTGLDMVRMITFDADNVLLGRAFTYAPVAVGEAGMRNLLEPVEEEMRVAMALTGAKSIGETNADSLAHELGA